MKKFQQFFKLLSSFIRNTNLKCNFMQKIVPPCSLKKYWFVFADMFFDIFTYLD